MGLHEWLLARGKRYQPDAALGEWLSVYRDDSRVWADHWADLHSLSRPVAVRAIAPTGTIGILAETTTGIEPIFCAAYKRRYLGPNNVWMYQYVVDPTAKRLVDAGVDPDAIEDATTLALDMERRLAFQAWVQEYVDMAISSTINLPPWESAGNSADTLPLYAEILLRYLPRLRGITVYPDGARGGQPLTPVSYREAAGREGVVYEETEERCVGGVCGV
jgi:ribonucleoside-diphosphate reductase alpha chain